MVDSQGTSAGIGFIGGLQLLFIALKLTGYIGWSWWWVWSPFIGAFLIMSSVIVVTICILGILNAMN